MKRTIILSLIFFIGFISLTGQELTINGGYGVARFDAEIESNWVPSPIIGIEYKHSLTKSSSIALDAFYLKRGSNLEYYVYGFNYTEKIDLNYFQFAPKYVLALFKNFAVETGISMDILLKGNSCVEWTYQGELLNEETDVEYETLGLSLNLGVRYCIDIGNSFAISTRILFLHGITNITNNSFRTYRNQNLNGLIGVTKKF